VNANKDKIDGKTGLKLVLAHASKVRVARGKRILEFEISDGEPRGEVTRDDLLDAIQGPSGNLRAPAIRKGKTMFVGFNDELFEKL